MVYALSFAASESQMMLRWCLCGPGPGSESGWCGSVTWNGKGWGQGEMVNCGLSVLAGDWSY